MIRCLLFVVLALILAAPAPAQAGAWLREKGKGFLAYSTLTTNTYDSTFSGYVDYGLRENLTVGLTIDVYAPLGGYVFGQGQVFMRAPLQWGGEQANWAYEIGIGVRHTGFEALPYSRTTLSFGTGFKLAERNGWVALDTGIEWDLAYAQHILKIDSTVGMELGGRSKGMIQVMAAQGRHFTNVTLAPTYIYQNKKKKVNYIVGLEYNSLLPKQIGLKFGVWQEF